MVREIKGVHSKKVLFGHIRPCLAFPWDEYLKQYPLLRTPSTQLEQAVIAYLEVTKVQVNYLESVNLDLYEKIDEITSYAVSQAIEFLDRANSHQCNTDEVKDAIDSALRHVISAVQRESSRPMYNQVGYCYSVARGLYRSSRFILESRIANAKTYLEFSDIFNTLCGTQANTRAHTDDLIDFIETYSNEHSPVQEHFQTYLNSCLQVALQSKDLTISRCILSKLKPRLFECTPRLEFANKFIPMLEKESENNFRKSVLRFLKAEAGVSIPKIHVMSQSLRMEIDEVDLEELSANASSALLASDRLTHGTTMRRI